MATNKNITMKQCNGVDYDTLYPQTLISQIIGSIDADTLQGSTLGQVIASAQSGLAKIATGSYVGTGTYGSANPNSLTFDFVPKLIMIFRQFTGTIYGVSIIIYNSKSQIANNSSGTLTWITANNQNVAPQYTWFQNSVSWIAADASMQLNESGSTYFYAVIG